MVVFYEVGARDDDGVSKAAVLCGVLHLLREDVAAVDYASDVGYEDLSVGLGFANSVFAEIYVFDTFVGKCGRPVDAGLVVAVYGSGDCGVGHTKVGGAKADV